MERNTIMSTKSTNENNDEALGADLSAVTEQDDTHNEEPLKGAENQSYDELDAKEETVPSEKIQSESDYLEDDELWSRAQDEILFSDESSVIAQQEEAVVKWDIQGLYDEDGKVRSKRSLRNNPPLLVVSDSTDVTASFVLTKDLSGNLAKHFENTYRAYYGIRPKKEMSFKEKVTDAKTGVRENMGKVIVIGGLIVGLLIFGIFF